MGNADSWGWRNRARGKCNSSLDSGLDTYCQSICLHPNVVRIPLGIQNQVSGLSVWETLGSYSRFLALRFPFCKRTGWGVRNTRTESERCSRGSREQVDAADPGICQTVPQTAWWRTRQWDKKTVLRGCYRWAWHIRVAFSGNFSLISILLRRVLCAENQHLVNSFGGCLKR